MCVWQSYILFNHSLIFEWCSPSWYSRSHVKSLWVIYFTLWTKQWKFCVLSHFFTLTLLSLDTALTDPQGNALFWMCKRKMLCYATLHYVDLCWSVTDSSLIHAVYYLPLSVYAKLHFGIVWSRFTVSLVAWRELGINFFFLGLKLLSNSRPLEYVFACVHSPEDPKVVARLHSFSLSLCLLISHTPLVLPPSLSHFLFDFLSVCATCSPLLWPCWRQICFPLASWNPLWEWNQWGIT